MHILRQRIRAAAAFVALLTCPRIGTTQSPPVSPPCAIEACALWSDGFTILRGIPGTPVGWDGLRGAIAARPALLPLAQKYYDARGREVMTNAAIWGVATVVPLGWTALWTMRSLVSLGGADSVEDESSKLRREFLVAAGGIADPPPAAMRSPRYVLSQQHVIDARSGASVAVMRPLWESLDPIKPLLGTNPEALRWFEGAKSAQRWHRISTTTLPVAWLAMFSGFAMAFAGTDNASLSGTLFFGGAAGFATSLAVRVTSERSTRRDIGRALYLATPP